MLQLCRFANVQVQREIHLHSRLHHANIVQLYAAFKDADGVYIAQEYLPGQSISAMLCKSGGYLPERQVALGITAPLMSALAHLHSQVRPPTPTVM